MLINDVIFTIAADPGNYLSAMGHVADATKAAANVAINAFKTVGQTSEDVSSDVVEQQSAMANAFEEMQSHLKAALEDFAQGIKDTLSGVFDDIKEKSKIAAIAIGAAFAALGLGAIYTTYKAIGAAAGFVGGLFTGQSYNNENINKLTAAAEQMETLRQQMNLTREAASAFSLAFATVGISQDEFLSVSGQVISAVRNNAETFKYLGITTQETGHRMTDFQVIGTSAVKVLESFAVGYDRDAAARAAGLPSYTTLKNALKVNEESFAKAREEAARFSLFIGNDVAAEIKKYQDAVNAFKQQSDLTWNGFSRAIADGVMPILGDLADFFKDGLPSIVNFTRGVVGSVVSLFHGFLMSIYTVTETIRGAIMATIASVSALAAALKKVVAGDFGSAWGDIKSAGSSASAEMGKSFDNIAARAETTAKRMKMAFLGGQEGAIQTASDLGQKRRYNPKPADSPSRAASGSPAEKSRMSEWEAELAEAKVFFQKTYDLREYSKQQELEYWQSILRNVAVTGQEKIALTRKISGLELEIMKKNKQQMADLEAQSIDATEKRMLDTLDMVQAQSQSEYQLGKINKQQLIALEQQFEAQKYSVQKDAQNARIAAMEGDPNADPVAKQKLLDHLAELERAHAIRTQKIQSDAALHVKQQWDSLLSPVTSAIEKSITGMIMGTITLRKALSNLFQSILGEFVNFGAKMLMQWAANELAKTNIVKQGSLLRLALEKMGLLEVTATKVATDATQASSATATAAVVVPAEAAEAAGGAASAVADIPYVGPALAAAAFAATMAMVLGGLRSAAGGYDIPPGVNPVTQLHAEEMVLPAQYANMIRGLTASGGAGGNISLHVSAVDAASVERLFRDSGHVLARELRRQARNFTPRNV